MFRAIPRTSRIFFFCDFFCDFFSFFCFNLFPIIRLDNTLCGDTSRPRFGCHFFPQLRNRLIRCFWGGVCSKKREKIDYVRLGETRRSSRSHIRGTESSKRVQGLGVLNLALVIQIVRPHKTRAAVFELCLSGEG